MVVVYVVLGVTCDCGTRAGILAHLAIGEPLCCLCENAEQVMSLEAERARPSRLS